MATTTIEWTRGDDGTAGEVWNPTTGCDKVSDGCDNCYALTMAKRLKRMGNPKYQTDGDPRTSGPGFGLAMHAAALSLPLAWKRPRRIFTNSMSDLFHPQVTDAFLAEVFAVMARTPQHTYQVLTKRAPRMASLLNRRSFRDNLAHWGQPWPLPNVWLGVSVENQEQADARIPRLLQTPTAVPWLSCEPLLGPVDLTRWLGDETVVGRFDGADGWENIEGPGVRWVVVGGESGKGARPMDPDWVRSLVDQCGEAGVPLFFKQAGAVLARQWGCTDPKGHKPEDWPEPFPRQFPTAVAA